MSRLLAEQHGYTDIGTQDSKRTSRCCKPCCCPFIVGFIVASVVVSLVWCGVLHSQQQQSTPDDATHSSYKEYDYAAVATDAGPCSTIGKNFLQNGGSVVDAAIGAMLCVGIYNAHSTGIGGGSFMNIYDATTGESVFINSREIAPMNSTADIYHGDPTLSEMGEPNPKILQWSTQKYTSAIKSVVDRLSGASAIAVPGEIAGYWEAHQRFGKLPWKDLFEPAIKLAAEGFPVNSALAKAINTSDITQPDYNLKPIFVNANGTRKGEGDIVTSPSLASTLRAIAEEGAKAFYNGSLTRRIIDDMRDVPGEKSRIEQHDLNQYRVEVKPSINITIGDIMVLTPGAPSGGPVLSYILNILKGYHFTSENVKDTDAEVLTYHRILEAFKFAYAKRTELGDDNFNANITKIVEQLTNETFAEETRLKIDDWTTYPPEHYGADFLLTPNDEGTAHLSIVGPDGSAIAMTSTINSYFGSKVRGLRTGIIFNNGMNDFSSPNITNMFGVPPSPTNSIEPGKRALSSMSPTILINTKKSGIKAVRIVCGASGGPKITTATAWTIMNMLWFGKRVDEAVNLKRLHHQLEPNETQFEMGFEKEVLDGLKAKNHNTKEYEAPGSIVQAIQRLSNGHLGAKSDERKGGYPDGY